MDLGIIFTQKQEKSGSSIIELIGEDRAIEL